MQHKATVITEHMVTIGQLTISYIHPYTVAHLLPGADYCCL